MEYSKPRVVISKCIEFDSVRWDGQKVSSDLVRQLQSHLKFIPVCPEVEIGLGVPRDTLRIVAENDEMKLIQPKTGIDVTERIEEFSETFLNSLSDVDGFILKSRSPTSAIKDAKIYTNIEGPTYKKKGPGFFGKKILEHFPFLAIEDEGRLRNPRIKHHFLIRIFTFAKFRDVKKQFSLKALTKFHTVHKLLLKSYNQRELGILGRIVANKDGKPESEILTEYQEHLYKAMRTPPRCGSNINVMLHAMGGFSDDLSSDEKEFFLNSLRDYKAGKIPFSVILSIVQSWIVRFQDSYLQEQMFFQPYPKELIDISLMTSYCDGKDFWK